MQTELYSPGRPHPAIPNPSTDPYQFDLLFYKDGVFEEMDSQGSERFMQNYITLHNGTDEPFFERFRGGWVYVINFKTRTATGYAVPIG